MTTLCCRGAGGAVRVQAAAVLALLSNQALVHAREGEEREQRSAPSERAANRMFSMGGPLDGHSVYEAIRLVGRGQRSFVQVARNRITGEVVAIKFIPRGVPFWDHAGRRALLALVAPVGLTPGSNTTSCVRRLGGGAQQVHRTVSASGWPEPLLGQRAAQRRPPQHASAPGSCTEQPVQPSAATTPLLDVLRAPRWWATRS